MTKPTRAPESRAYGRGPGAAGAGEPLALRWLYSFGFTAFALLYLPFFLLRGKHKTGLGARLGRVPSPLRAQLRTKNVVWVHGVSVGEIAQAFRLISAMREKRPALSFVITATTGTGLEVARQLKDEEDAVLPFPADFRFAVRDFIESVMPQAVIVLETEIWPNMIFELSSRGIPLYIVNGRISDRAIGGYRAVRGLFKTVLRRVERIGAQDELSRARFIEMGADPSRVTVTGNMKFDWQPPAANAQADALGQTLKKDGAFLFVAGSTHEGEETAVMELWRKLRGRHPRLRLVIAPRHPDRIAGIEAAARQLNIRTVRSSALRGSIEPDAVALVDGMGLLAGLYRYADAVFVGGSLVPVGGHNLVEPAYYERPILFGPHTENFKEMTAAFLDAKAGIRVDSAAALEEALLGWLGNETDSKHMGRRAKAIVVKNQGATERTLENVLQTMNDRRQ